MPRYTFPKDGFDDSGLRSGIPSVPVFGRFARFIRGLPPSDKFVAGVLTGIVALTCLISLGALLRSFQVAVPGYGGSISEGVMGAPRFVNPLLAISDTDRDLVTLTYAGLMGYDAKGTLVPVLAESYTVSPDGTIYTFTLRQDAQFSDGTPVTADDVVYTVGKAQDPGLKSPQLASWANIRAEALDARTVRFTLPKAYAPFLEDTTLGILPKHIWQDVSNAEFPFSPYTTHPVGAGPYTAATITSDSDGVITKYSLTAFKKYALGRPHLSRISFSFYEDQASLRSALANGTVTSAYGVVTQQAIAVPYARVFGIFFNPDAQPEFKDKGVREALSLAIDRDSLVKNVLGGYATAINGPLSPQSDATLTPLPDSATRLADAKAALEDAGYTFDDEKKEWMKDGQALQVTLKTSNVPELKPVATEIKNEWEAFGVPTDLEFYDANSLTQTVIRPRNYGALLFGEVLGTDPDLYAFWAGSERADPGLNIADYQDDDVDALLAKARTQTGTDKQATLSQIESAISSDYPAAFMYSPDFLYTLPPKVQGISLSAVSSPADRFDGIASWYRYTDHVWPVFSKL